jgi:hypothetical protein
MAKNNNNSSIIIIANKPMAWIMVNEIIILMVINNIN